MFCNVLYNMFCYFNNFYRTPAVREGWLFTPQRTSICAPNWQH